MKKMVLVLIVFMLTGCVGLGAPDGEGYIIEVFDGKVLVIDDHILDATWNDISDEYSGSAIMLSTKKKRLKPGQKIRYWINGGVNDSYPQQAQAKRIEVIN